MKTYAKDLEALMILACHGIEKAFGEEVIVHDGSFHIEEYEKTALVGSNGAGKTTLLKMIVGELLPDAGSVTTVSYTHLTLPTTPYV